MLVNTVGKKKGRHINDVCCDCVRQYFSILLCVLQSVCFVSMFASGIFWLSTMHVIYNLRISRASTDILAERWTLAKSGADWFETQPTAAGLKEERRDKTVNFHQFCWQAIFFTLDPLIEQCINGFWVTLPLLFKQYEIVALLVSIK